MRSSGSSRAAPRSECLTAPPIAISNGLGPPPRPGIQSSEAAQSSAGAGIGGKVGAPAPRRPPSRSGAASEHEKWSSWGEALLSQAAMKRARQRPGNFDPRACNRDFIQRAQGGAIRPVENEPASRSCRKGAANPRCAARRRKPRCGAPARPKGSAKSLRRTARDYPTEGARNRRRASGAAILAQVIAENRASRPAWLRFATQTRRLARSTTARCARPARR